METIFNNLARYTEKRIVNQIMSYVTSLMGSP